MHATLCWAFVCLAALPVPVATLGIFAVQRESKHLSAQRVGAIDPSVTATVEVPEPVDVGADGFPALPAVAQILGQASRTLKVVSSQANDIVGHMVSAQEQSEAQLGRQKHAFEGQLKSQEMKNQAVARQTQKISKDIDELEESNVQLRKQAHDVQKQNTVLRGVVHSLQSKLSLAKEFAATSMTETDDSKQSVLGVLQAPRGSDDDFLLDDRPALEDDEEQDDTDEGTSLLSISSTVQHTATNKGSEQSDLEAALAGVSSPQQLASQESPDALLSVLSKDVATLVQQRKQTVSSLKNLFIRDYRAGARRHLELLNQQKVLQKEKEGLEALQSKLKAAVAHLKGTHSQLGHKLHGLGQFLQKLVHVANAPEPEVSNLLDNLPRTVSVASKAII